MLNIYKIIEKCKQVEVRNIFVSGLVYTTRVNLPILERVYNLISTYCRENVCFEIDKRIKYQRVFVYIKMVLIY